MAIHPVLYWDSHNQAKEQLYNVSTAITTYYIFFTSTNYPWCTYVSSHFLSFPGILHKGSGENIFVTEQPPVITSIMGNGRRRSISCPSCNGLADGNKLLAPVALAMGIDGSLYVGDLNFVRRVYPSMNTTGILELRYILKSNAKIAIIGFVLFIFNTAAFKK